MSVSVLLARCARFVLVRLLHKQSNHVFFWECFFFFFYCFTILHRKKTKWDVEAVSQWSILIVNVVVKNLKLYIKHFHSLTAVCVGIDPKFPKKCLKTLK